MGSFLILQVFGAYSGRRKRIRPAAITEVLSPGNNLNDQDASHNHQADIDEAQKAVPFHALIDGAGQQDRELQLQAARERNIA